MCITAVVTSLGASKASDTARAPASAPLCLPLPLSGTEGLTRIFKKGSSMSALKFTQSPETLPVSLVFSIHLPRVRQSCSLLRGWCLRRPQALAQPRKPHPEAALPAPQLPHSPKINAAISKGIKHPDKPTPS